MLLSIPFLLAAYLLVVPAFAGSRLWESPLTHVRKRAVAVQPQDGNSGVRLWPDRTLTYAFADTKVSDARKGLFVQAQEVWGRLKHYDFKYNEISLSKCKSDRTNCLLIEWNDRGVLGSSVAKPAADKDFDGPTMRLSDSFAVGNRNPILNVAHEIGHAWGLFHEHQNFQRWKTSPEHGAGNSQWETYKGDIFHTNRFNCENLKDYDEVVAKVNEGSDPDQNQFKIERMCTSYATASVLGFSAKEWLPMDLAGKSADPEFDPDSLMLYPSWAGGKGDADENNEGRSLVLTYADGSPIPIRQGPSDWDITKLVTLYGTATKAASEPYVKKGSKMENLFKKMRGESTRAGDTAGGLC